VSSPRERVTMLSMLGSLGWPMLLGAAGCTLFYAAIYQGVFESPLFHRYFATHPVSFVATGMFCVGLAALVLKLVNLGGQISAMRGMYLDGSTEADESVSRCSEMLEEMNDLSASARSSYLGCRLHDALEYVERKGNASGLDDELKYLADMDAARQHDSFALVRIIIWATPMLGFLGTVVGITQALGDLDPKMLATAIQTAMDGLLAGLYVAFDTTALALSLSIVLMFLQFLVDRIETQLLEQVDKRINEELVGRFRESEQAPDPHVAVVQKMADQLVRGSETLVSRQTELWQAAMVSADERLVKASDAFADRLDAALQTTLGQSLTRFADRLAQAEEEAADQARRRWGQGQTGLSNGARMLQSQQQEMIRQGETLQRVLEATGSVIKLETALNNNLKALSGAKNFEDTVMSLAAAIHLLNSRLGVSLDDTPPIDLDPPDAQGRAA